MEDFRGEKIPVCLTLLNSLHQPIAPVQEALPIFKSLAEVTKFMEGESYFLSSSYWVALSAIEKVMAPNLADSDPVKALRAAMARYHFNKRVTIQQSTQNPLHVLMHLLDHRCVICARSLTVLLLCHCFSFVCWERSWRHNRVGVLTDAQYAAAKAIALQYIPKFFPGDVLQPVFVSLHPNVTTKLNELKEELKDAHEAFPAPPPPAPAPVPAAAVPPPLSAPFALGFHSELDRGIDMKVDLEMPDGKHDMQWELSYWFNDVAPSLLWNASASQPDVNWKRDEVLLPRLARLARRFLCILPSSASSERIWSGFGHILSNQSAHMDSTIAAQTMYLRYNQDTAAQVKP